MLELKPTLEHFVFLMAALTVLLVFSISLIPMAILQEEVLVLVAPLAVIIAKVEAILLVFVEEVPFIPKVSITVLIILAVLLEQLTTTIVVQPVSVEVIVVRLFQVVPRHQQSTPSLHALQ